MKWIFTSSLLAFSLSATVNTDDQVFRKIAELRLKSNAHSKFVSELLSEDDKVEPIKFKEAVSLPAEPLVTEKESSGLPLVVIPQQEDEDFVPQSQDVADIDLASGEQGNNFPAKEENIEYQIDEEGTSSNDSAAPTYDELYDPKIPQRRIGYYFGPLLGAVLPNDNSVRKSDGTKISYGANSGFVGGFRLGNDFGYARLEGEYAFVSHGIETGSVSGESNIHSVNSRLILEKSLGEQADLRVGIGLGIGFVNHELNGNEYDGVGFSYDFLLGWSYRVMNNWSINLDYRNYLTAAHENYDRLQGHIIEISAGFDL